MIKIGQRVSVNENQKNRSDTNKCYKMGTITGETEIQVI